jgi:16S rRNA A1518/A1519 N6-dimethyltransferase RsmA/KsgA/DIM1 with predicted DNA glycosylase/AP lyase activity
LRELDEHFFEEVVRGVFTQRRRLLRGALLHFLTKKLGREVGKTVRAEIVFPELRVYQLSIAQLEDLTVQLSPRLAGKIPSEEKDNN